MAFWRSPCCLSFGILSLHFLFCLSSFCVLFRPLAMSLDFPFLIILSLDFSILDCHFSKFSILDCHFDFSNIYSCQRMERYFLVTRSSLYQGFLEDKLKSSLSRSPQSLDLQLRNICITHDHMNIMTGITSGERTANPSTVQSNLY